MQHLNYKRQAGWSLIETTLAVAVLSVVATLCFSLLMYAQRSNTAVQTSDELLGAQNTAQGVALSSFALPRPDDAQPSPGRPGYLEGWLPGTGALGGNNAARTRYLVNEALVSTSVLYQPDGAKLLGDLLPTRTQPNGLDLCFNLIQQEQKGKGLPDGQRVAYGLQRPMTGNATQPTQWMDSTDPSVTAALDTRLLGYNELASDLGCLEAMSTLTAAIKAAAVYVDLVKLAQVNLDMRQAVLDYADLSVTLYILREAIWNTALITSIGNLTITLGNMAVASAGGAAPAILLNTLQIAKGLLIIATNEEYVRRTTELLEAAKVNLEKQTKRRDEAIKYSDDLQAELNRRVDIASNLQQGGLQ